LLKPKELCKYYALNTNNLKAILNKYFYGSHPFDLNDPFDVNKNMLNLDSTNLDEYYHFIFSHIGILSLTVSDIDPLMWSHYCSHNGFVVKYSLDKIPSNFLGPFPINYINSYKPINQNDPFLRLLIASNIKYKRFWESENEWRFLLYSSVLMKLPKIFQNQLLSKNRSRKSRFFSYNNYFSIKEVILGYKLLLNENVKLKIIQNVGFDISTNDCVIQRFLNFLYKKRIRTFIVDIHPTSYPFFMKKEIIIMPTRKNKFTLEFIIR